MGTYTTNYQLYIPTVGETGWGTLVNGNFATIDTTMKGLSNRIGILESDVNSLESTVGGLDSRIITVENATKVLTNTRTLASSAPYTVGNLVVYELPTIENIGKNTSNQKTVTIPALPTSVSTPFGTFSITRPTLSTTWKVYGGAITGTSSITVTVKLNGTQVWSGSVSYNNPATFTFNINTAISNTIVASSSTDTASAMPDMTPQSVIYLK